MEKIIVDNGKRNGVYTEVVCPCCGVIYEAIVPVEHFERQCSWRQSGYIVIICEECSLVNDRISKKFGLDRMERWHKYV